MSEVEEDQLLELIKMLPQGIVLFSTWAYQYHDIVQADLGDDVSINLYVFKWGDIDCTSYFSLRMVQEKFDILNLHKRILSKSREGLTQHEVSYLYRYFKKKEMI